MHEAARNRRRKRYTYVFPLKDGTPWMHRMTQSRSVPGPKVVQKDGRCLSISIQTAAGMRDRMPRFFSIKYHTNVSCGLDVLRNETMTNLRSHFCYARTSLSVILRAVSASGLFPSTRWTTLSCAIPWPFSGHGRWRTCAYHQSSARQSVFVSHHSLHSLAVTGC